MVEVAGEEIEMLMIHVLMRDEAVLHTLELC